MILLYYTAATVILSGVDAWRIYYKNKRIRNPVGNNDISHAVSRGLAIAVAVGLWLVFMRPLISWQALLFAVGCIGVRGLLFDPLLNLFRRLPVNYVSRYTSSGVDQRLAGIAFYWRRAGYAVILAAVILKLAISFKQ